LSKLVRDLDLNVSTRWRAAHEVILGAPAFRQNPEMQKVETIDILTVWGDYSRQLEQEHETESKRLRIERVRKARKAREGFVALLHELKLDGSLTRQSKWKDLYPKIKKDERYESLLGMAGSSPLDLWMDVVDDMQDEAERGAEKVQQFLKQAQRVVEIDTKWEEFEVWIKNVTMEDKLKRDVYDFVSHPSTVREARI
jgi:pre-mRNA-processing factor 40